MSLKQKNIVLQIPIFVHLPKRIGLFFQKSPGSKWVVTRRPGRLQCSHRLGLIGFMFYI